MKNTSQKCLKGSMLALIAFLAILVFGGPVPAGDYNTQTNLDEVAGQLARWSEQSSMGQLTPQAQKKLGELLMETSKMLKQMGMKGGADMSMEHHKEIEMMKKEWDPFDTSDKM